MDDILSGTKQQVLDSVRDWDSVKDFAEWYSSFGFPLLCPSDFEVYISDDAITFPIFRYNNFQVELYILDNDYKIAEHSHPYVDVIQSVLDKNSQYNWSPINLTLIYPDTHGSGNFNVFNDPDIPNEDKRTLLLTFEKWPKNTKPSTLAAVWKGKLAGPLQEQLVRRFFPNAFIHNGYADITRTNNAT